MRQFLPDRWEVAGFVLVAFAAMCFAKAGEAGYIARHVWEDAERIQKAAEKDAGKET